MSSARINGNLAEREQVIILENFIRGEFVASENLGYINSYEPSTGQVWAQLPDSGDEEVCRAVTAAKNAFPKWSSLSTHERASYLNKIADLIEQRLDEFAEAESRDSGKPVALARLVDIPRAVHNFRFFASAVQHYISTSNFNDQHGALNYVHRSPVGVAGLISPWNLPLYLLTFKIAPAIAAGCTVVAKPSEMTSVTTWMMCKVFQDVGLPAGVVNVVFGYGGKVGEALVKHPDVPVISFTGSTPIGQRITAVSAPFCKKLSLELGGKNAAIIFDDVNLDEVVPGSVRSSFMNQGEVCLCSSRIFVQRGIYDEFLTKFTEAAKKFKVGVPSDPSVNMGALISEQHREKVRSFIQLAESEGATINCGGDQVPECIPETHKNGYYLAPTVISNISDRSPCMQDEIFGPVTCVVPFDNEEEVVERANAVKYGLCAVVWTKDLSRTHRLARKLHVGTVWANCWLVRDLNMPFGGSKASGIGREGCKESLDFYTESRTVCIKLG
ncbi:2-aminomuconic semialdehyde dehydrogenase-like [Paramacrobiotus metropolitanus]|uniref:2-aminomuconic semialdehyde dehydrogenase-like n=1 Tax=Paramacrobiotus metropolitanus TaxID=2943436 RepID=UPI002446131D|nr:2-aminomuconic semialdehyde dehydrogenase-like [Paramacrobiotus metropolitanus]